MGTTIFHITRDQDWHQALQLGHYQSLRFDQEKFIHCSTHTQILRVLNSHFSDTKGLVLLEIEQDAVLSPVVYEGDGELFPHIYGRLNIGAIRAAHRLTSRDQLPIPLVLYKDMLFRPANDADKLDERDLENQKLFVVEKNGRILASAESRGKGQVFVFFKYEVDTEIEHAFKNYVSQFDTP